MGTTEKDLKGKTVAELQQIAASAGVSRTKGVKKADLITAIVGKGSSKPSSNGAAKSESAPAPRRDSRGRSERGEGDSDRDQQTQGRRGRGSDSDDSASQGRQDQHSDRGQQTGQQDRPDRQQRQRDGGRDGGQRDGGRDSGQRDGGQRDSGPRDSGPRDGGRNEGGFDGNRRNNDRQRQQGGYQQGGYQQGGGRGGDDRRERRRRKKGKGPGGGGGQGGGGQGGGRLPQGADREWSTEDLEAEGAIMLTGVLDVMPDGYGFVRAGGCMQTGRDAYVPQQVVRRLSLRKGDEISGWVRPIREGEKFAPMLKIEQVNEKAPELAKHRPDFKDLTPLFPDERFRLEWGPKAITERVIDLISPIGKGQRALIVSPPKAGKTTVLKQIANGIRANSPDVHLIVLLVDERPEEVTDWRRTVKADEVAYSTFDRPASEHTQVAELVLARAQRLVEQKRDVVVMLDSITRLARAYNLAAPASGRILSGGVDSGALYPPKRFFGAARNIEEGGSLTIIASALVDTGSKMDEVIFEEFKGTGNSEIRLDRGLSEKRIFPAIDIEGSSTRKEELLYTKEELPLVWRWRRLLAALEPRQAMELLRDKMLQTETNSHLLVEISKMKNVD